MSKATIAILVMLVTSPNLLISPALAQGFANGVKPEQLAAAIDVIWNIKNAVTKEHKGKETETYKAISFRLFECSLIYGIFVSKNAPPSSQELLAANANIYITAGSFLYPDTAENYKIDLLKVKETLMKQKLENDKKKQFYFLRSCSDFSVSTNVENAIAEILLDK
jgi:hypothetical protein